MNTIDIYLQLICFFFVFCNRFVWRHKTLVFNAQYMVAYEPHTSSLMCTTMIKMNEKINYILNSLDERKLSRKANSIWLRIGRNANVNDR